MIIKLATIQDVPALLDLQRKAFAPLCEELEWKDAPLGGSAHVTLLTLMETS